ncbi:hypothetical protein [Candidatus Albibeggiatoa sp. nov. NOAA]|uniref:hypothetical protein n=1 Tax=Candidatus Albibeggiatoa sp. nov. NOAA TaxID=3162724 RepID=UPI0032F45C50|nr:hypothetical protein [Thiotrichaceae bacterium]
MGYSHCLHPTKTEQVVKALLENHSVNFIGEDIEGCSRVLEDIQHIALDNVIVVLVNVKSYHQSYQGLIGAIWAGCQQSRELESLDFATLVTALEKLDCRVILLLNYFDALLNTPDLDAKYDMKFFDNLNSLKQQSNISLLCATQKPHNHSWIYINGKIHSKSKLDLEKTYLRKLSLKNMRIEIQRHYPDLSDIELSDFTRTCYEHRDKYCFFQFCLDSLIDEDVSLTSQLIDWKSDYEDYQPKFSLPKKADKGLEKLKILQSIGKEYYSVLKGLGIFAGLVILWKWISGFFGSS